MQFLFQVYVNAEKGINLCFLLTQAVQGMELPPGILAVWLSFKNIVGILSMRGLSWA